MTKNYRRKSQVKVTIQAQVEEHFGISNGQLRAIVFSNREKTKTIIYGPKKIVGSSALGRFKKSGISVRKLRVLSKVPRISNQNCFSFIDARRCGLQSGKILLIEGLPD